MQQAREQGQPGASGMLTSNQPAGTDGRFTAKPSGTCPDSPPGPSQCATHLHTLRGRWSPWQRSPRRRRCTLRSAMRPRSGPRARTCTHRSHLHTRTPVEKHAYVPVAGRQAAVRAACMGYTSTSQSQPGMSVEARPAWHHACTRTRGHERTGTLRLRLRLLLTHAVVSELPLVHVGVDEAVHALAVLLVGLVLPLIHVTCTRPAMQRHVGASSLHCTSSSSASSSSWLGRCTLCRNCPLMHRDSLTAG